MGSAKTLSNEGRVPQRQEKMILVPDAPGFCDSWPKRRRKEVKVTFIPSAATRLSHSARGWMKTARVRCECFWEVSAVGTVSPRRNAVGVSDGL